MIRYLMIIMVCILYAIPLIRTSQLSEPPSIKYTNYNQEGNRSNSPEPFYSASFINDEVDGTQCHASSITSAGRGRMVSVWYAGSREGAKDVALYRSFYNDHQQMLH